MKKQGDEKARLRRAPLALHSLHEAFSYGLFLNHFYLTSQQCTFIFFSVLSPLPLCV